MMSPEKILIGEDEVLVAEDLKEMILSMGDAGAGITGRRYRGGHEDPAGSAITITENGEPGKGARFEISMPKGAWRGHVEHECPRL